eukprot:gene7805-12279_t
MPTEKNNSQNFFNFEHPMDIEAFRKYGYQMVDKICDYYSNVQKKPVLSKVEPGYLEKLIPQEAPQKPEDFSKIISDVDEFIMPGMTHWQHPSFYAYFSSSSSFPGILGEMMSAMFNVFGFNWVCSPACTELEVIVLDWLAKALKLPKNFLSTGTGGGVIQGTASEATLISLVSARSKFIKEKIDSKKLIGYCSDQSHSSIQKAFMIAGIPDEQIRIIEANENEELDPKTLEEAVETDRLKGLIPFFVGATVGTTSSTAIDDISKIGPICKKYGMWLHVDAAYVGASCICPEYRHFLNGIEDADSFVFNPHKWMLTNFDCVTLWVQNRKSLTDALEITPEYLKNKASESGSVIDYRHWSISFGRRFRSLKLWFVMRSYGIEGLQAFIRHHIELAKFFEKEIQKDDRFEIAAQRTSSLVCFRLKNETNENNKQLLDNLNNSGKIYLVHTVLKKRIALRMAISGSNTKKEHIENAIKLIIDETDKLLKIKS